MTKTTHSLVVSIIIAVAVYALFAFFTGGKDVLQAIGSLPMSIWAAILGLSLANYFLRYWRWQWFIHHQQTYRLPHIQHLLIYLAGFTLTMTPGKAGEAMRSLYLKNLGVSHQKSLAALLMERILDLLAVLILAALGLSFLPGGEAKIAALITFSLIALCLLFIKLPKDKVLGLGLVTKLPEKLQKILHFVFDTLAHANQFLTLRFVLFGLLLGVVAWGLEGYGLLLVMQNFTLDSHSVFLALAIYGAAVLLGALSFLPGGLGGTEAVMIFMLVQAGFSVPHATAITLICRLATLWFAVLVGLIALALLAKMGVRIKGTTENV